MSELRITGFTGDGCGTGARGLTPEPRRVIPIKRVPARRFEVRTMRPRLLHVACAIIMGNSYWAPFDIAMSERAAAEFDRKAGA